MQLEVGEILEGKVTGILKFGAFVDLGGGKSGMVHISEVAPTYVSAEAHRKPQYSKPRNGDAMGKDKDSEPPRPRSHPVKKPVKKEQPTLEELQYAYEPKSTVTDAGFEDMLSRFKMSSEDRMSGLKTMDVKKRGRRK